MKTSVVRICPSPPGIPRIQVDLEFYDDADPRWPRMCEVRLCLKKKQVRGQDLDQIRDAAISEAHAFLKQIITSPSSTGPEAPADNEG